MNNIVPYSWLVDQIWQILAQARSHVSSQVNQTMITTYWTIGQYIVEYEQGGADRAQYGSWLLQRLADDLTARFGRGFGYRNLRQMKQFYLEYNNWQAMTAKLKNLSRTHVVRLMHIKDTKETMINP